MKKLLNVFIALLVVLTAASVYFTFVKPVEFSNLIKREGVSRYAELVMVLPDDLAWIRGVMAPGEESKNVYGDTDWKLLGFEEVSLGGKSYAVANIKVKIVEFSSGILKYGKYTLVEGNKIYFIDSHHFLEGRIYKYKVLDEKAPF